MAAHLESRATLPWLVRLRWIALAGQLVALLLYYREIWRDSEATFPPFSTIFLVAFGVVSNLALAVWLRRVPDPPQADRIMGGVLTLDTIFLTALLASSGGPENPFTIFYLVHIVLAALVLQTRTTVWITTLSALCFGALFLVGDDADAHAHHGHHGAAMTGHLRGMWIAFAIASSVIAYFVRKISLTIAAQREQIAHLRESAAMNARLASLATLAAGAAHELGTPLGTIAVAAHELERTLAGPPPSSDALDDARLIALEVDRCRKILGGMAARTAEEDQRPSETTPVQVFELLRQRIGADRNDRLTCRVDGESVSFTCALPGLLGALASLVKNGFDSADRDTGEVAVVFRRERDTQISFTVHDDGPGMAPEVAARAGEPFFTTKEPGHGMGLGLFLARAFAESSGGRLELRSRPGLGTDAVLWLPRRPGLELGVA